MSLFEIVTNGASAAVVILTLVQVVPIKIDPWTAIAKAIGRAINADVLKELESVKAAEKRMQEQLEERIKVEDERNADVHRERILQFNLELIRNLKHTKEDFDDILTEIDDYEEYCKNHPDYPNQRAVHAIKNIERVYDDRMRKQDFCGMEMTE